MRKVGLLAAVVIFVGSQWVAAANLQMPERVPSGQDLSIRTNGDGNSTLYLFGPTHALKRSVKLGGAVTIEGSELTAAGRYVVTIEHSSGVFFVTAGPVANVAFIARPSRVPAATKDVVSGTAFLFDRNQNLVLAPQEVSFNLAVPGAGEVHRTATSHNGIAWTRVDSSRQAGAAQFVASSGSASVRRVVQEVASDPCNIRMHAERGKDGAIVVQTDPVHDCAGNAVPDGTIVTFTSVDASGRSTVDARIKRGIARAELPASPGATISVASGVVVGNEIRWEGQR